MIFLYREITFERPIPWENITTTGIADEFVKQLRQDLPAGTPTATVEAYLGRLAVPFRYVHYVPLMQGSPDHKEDSGFHLSRSLGSIGMIVHILVDDAGRVRDIESNGDRP